MTASRMHRAQGFSLIEVMISLVIAGVGLLGLAKMESLALASTDVAGTRSIAALQASSLASMMHANRAYWGGGFAIASTTVQITSGAVAISNGALAAGTACTTPGTSACNYTQMAAYDLNNWATQLQSLLPGYLTTISCSTTGFPVNCTIQITWTEQGVAVTSQQTQIGTVGGLALPTYTMYVEP
jgi:type IV pilus assembly protein PilV